MMTPDGIGALLRSIRQKADRTQEEQAQLVQTELGAFFDHENIKRWEREKRLPIPARYPAIARAYGITVEDVRRAVASSRRHRRIQQGKEDPDVNRRKFIGVAATAAGISALPGIAEARTSIDSALGTSDTGDLAYLEAAFERHRAGYHGRTPEQALADMRGDLHVLQGLLNRPLPAKHRANLTRTTAGITGLVAIIQHDRGDQRDAARWFTTAERAAHESGDRHMTAWVLARHAMVPLNYGAPAAAARLAARARHEASTTPTAAAALAAAVTARALAALHDTDRAVRAIDEARRIADRLAPAQTADTWFGYPPQKHYVHLSQAHTLLGNTRAATNAQTNALAATGPGSVITRALLAMDTAACTRATGDPATAADIAIQTLADLPASYQNGLVHSRARSLLQQLDGRPHAHLAAALQ